MPKLILKKSPRVMTLKKSTPKAKPKMKLKPKKYAPNPRYTA